MFRNVRAFSPFSRSLYRSRSALSQYHGVVAVRRVRLVRPIFTRRRIRTLALYTASFIAFHSVFNYLGDEEEDAEERQTGQPESERVEQDTPRKLHNSDGDLASGSDSDTEDDVQLPDEAPEDSWFIPLGLIYQRRPTLYKASDPEWQSFIAFSRDKKRNLAIRNELAGLVGAVFARTPAFEPLLGSPIHAGKYWLDVDYPGGPPPEYERAGLEWTNNYIAWTVRPISSINVSRLERTLWSWPKATVSSLWASSRALWELKFAKAREFFNYRADSEPTKPRFPPGFASLPHSTKPKDRAGLSSTPVPSTLNAPPDEPSPTSREVSGSSEKSKLSWKVKVPLIPKPSTEMEAALTVFKTNLANQWQPATMPPPRGSVVVSGLVQVRGSKGSCVVDVAAAYHPAKSRWLGISMTVRRAQPKSISPPGGL